MSSASEDKAVIAALKDIGAQLAKETNEAGKAVIAQAKAERRKLKRRLRSMERRLKAMEKRGEKP